MFNYSNMVTFDCWPDTESLLHNNLCGDTCDFKSYFNETWRKKIQNSMVEII